MSLGRSDIVARRPPHMFQCVDFRCYTNLLSHMASLPFQDEKTTTANCKVVYGSKKI